ncbi:MAG TPA: 5'-methylthioadenosine/adenosylhomocysteine nucleosidase [Pseudogracilibacillus sp.]|nr:5'-methylthioadenosine/adenosylhomocysteine nucleosidase [Pseudogracilibacillus sp.]
MVIGIIGAMDEEIALLKSKMTEVTETNISQIDFYKGQLAGKEVVLMKSGIGKVNAAISATILHEHFNPSLVINAGSAGGLKEKHSVGDIIISSEVIHHDADATVFNYKLGQIPQMPETFVACKDLINLVKKSVTKLGLPADIGLIGTGDSFIGRENQVKHIKANFPDIVATEMEAVSVAQVCYTYQTPFVIIRALSDIAGKDSSILFEEFLEKAATNSAKVIIETIKQL